MYGYEETVCTAWRCVSDLPTALHVSNWHQPVRRVMESVKQYCTVMHSTHPYHRMKCRQLIITDGSPLATSHLNGSLFVGKEPTSTVIEQTSIELYWTVAGIPVSDSNE